MKLTKGFKGRYFSLAAIAATVSCVQMHAQNTQAIQLEKIVVSAANTEEEEEAVTEDVTVITADEISERGYQTLKDALASVPGITFTSNGGFGQPTNIYLRNFNSDHTLVLIDGIRVNDVTGLSGAQIEQYRLDDVERIEVIEGPQSGIWGADASAGVINIVTKYPRKKSVTFAFKGGNYDTKSLSFAFGDKNGAFDYRFALSHIDTDGFSAAEPGKSSPDYGKRGDDLGWEKDPYKNTTYRLNLGYDVSKNDRLEALMMAVDATVHYDASAGIDAKDLDDPFGFGLSSYANDIKNRFYNVAYLKKMDAHSAKLFYNFSTFHRTQYGGYTGSVKEAGLQDRFDYMEDGFLAGGAGYQGFHQGLSAGVDLGKKYANRYIYLSDHNALFNGATQFSGAVRYDNYTTFDNKATYKIGIKQKLIDEVFASANYGTGYNVPTLYRLYDSYAGNKNLTPETTRGYDISLAYDHHMKITYYKETIDRLIDYDYSLYQFVNIDGKSTFKGIELSFEQPLTESISARADYTRTLSAEDGQGNDLPRRANMKLGYGLTWYPTDEHTIDIHGYYVGTRYDDKAKSIQTGRYNVTDVALRHQFAKNFTGEIEVHNLFDRFYQEVDGYGTEGRSIYVGVTVRY